MRIGITCHANFGGSGVIATELGLSLAARGHEVHFICAHAPPRLISARNVTLHQVTSPTHPLFPHGDFTLALASRLAQVSTDHSLDVLHVHYAIPLATSALLARELTGLRAPKLVTTVHGTDVLTLGREPAFHPLVGHALQRSDLVTAPSRFLADAATREFGLGSGVVRVVENFVDTERFQPGTGARTSLGFPSEVSRVLTHNSNFRSLKRVQDVVEIFAKVRAQLPSCGLLLIGDGPERSATEALVAERQLGRWVRFVGEQAHVSPMLQASDVFLLPSEVESFGLAALEAMSCGVPVVASATGGLPEVVLDARTGFLHGVGGTEAMAGSVVKLLSDDALHRRLSAAARAWCLERWRLEPVIDTWERLYSELLGRPT